MAHPARCEDMVARQDWSRIRAPVCRRTDTESMELLRRTKVVENTMGSTMEKVIDVDFRIIWKYHVFVRIGDGTRECINGPDAALAALLHRWLTTSQSEYTVAKRRCVNAILKHGSPQLARSAFVEAAVAAKVLG